MNTSTPSITNGGTFRDDPLMRPHWQRYQPDDGIPF